METWYKFDHMPWRNEQRIKPVQVEKSTAATIWIDGRMNRTRSDYDNFFPTFEEAKAFGVEKYSRKVEQLKEQLQAAEKELAEIEALCL